MTDSCYLELRERRTLILYPMQQTLQEGLLHNKNLALRLKKSNLWWSVPGQLGVFHCLHSLHVSFQLPEAQCHLGLALHRHFLTEPGRGQADLPPLVIWLQQACIIFIWKVTNTYLRVAVKVEWASVCKTLNLGPGICWRQKDGDTEGNQLQFSPQWLLQAFTCLLNIL